jgi:hypothetical protein
MRSATSPLVAFNKLIWQQVTAPAVSTVIIMVIGKDLPLG